MMMTSKRKIKCNESNNFLEYNKIFEDQEIKCIRAKPARRNPFNDLKIVSILVFYFIV